MAYNPELQMLREVAWLILPQTRCFFCGDPLLNLEEALKMSFGHRRHTKVYEKLTVHHVDRDRENNHWNNLKLAHTACHKAYHGENRLPVIQEFGGRPHFSKPNEMKPRKVESVPDRKGKNESTDSGNVP